MTLKVSKDDIPKISTCLKKLGYPPEHELMQSLFTNQEIDLDHRDIAGFTPLRIAIQRQDTDAIQTLRSFEPHSKYLSSYDVAFLESMDGNHEKMKKLEMPSHTPFTHCVQVFYPACFDQGGLCFGIGEMRRQAFLAHDAETFCRRLKNIHYNLSPMIEEVMHEVAHDLINKAGNISADDERVMSDDIKAIFFGDPVDKDKKKRFFDKVREKLDGYFPYYIWYDIYAFLDGVNLYQSPDNFSDWFEAKTSLLQGRVPAESLVRPVVLEEENTSLSSLPTKTVLCGIYSEESIATYFSLLEQAFGDIRVSFKLNIGLHSLNIDYAQGNWWLTDANNLSFTEEALNSNQIAELFVRIYKTPLIFTARPSIALNSPSKNIERFYQAITDLTSNPKWLALHKINEEDCIQINSEGFCLLYLAAEAGDLDTVKSIIKACKSDVNIINQSTNNGVTALWIAVACGHLEVVEVLVKALKGDVDKINQPTNRGITPLLIAAQNGHLEIVKVLVEALKDDVDKINQPTPTDDGITPLWIAAKNGHFEVVKVLVEALKDDVDKINQPTDDGITPLWVAAQNGHLEVVKVLVEALNNNRDSARDINIALLFALKNGHVKVVEVLLSHIKPDQPISVSNEILIKTAKNDEQKELLKIFNTRNVAGQIDAFSPLHLAIYLGLEDLITKLLTEGATLEPTSSGIGRYEFAATMNRLSLFSVQNDEVINSKSTQAQGILDRFEGKITTIGQHKKNANTVASQLHDTLQQLKNETFFSPINDKILNQFVNQAKQEIKQVTSQLQEDLGWGDYLINLVKQLANLLVKTSSFGTCQGFFVLKSSGASEASRQVLHSLEDLISSNSVGLGSVNNF